MLLILILQVGLQELEINNELGIIINFTKIKIFLLYRIKIEIGMNCKI